jgi:hypothetical protein
VWDIINFKLMPNARNTDITKAHEARVVEEM